MKLLSSLPPARRHLAICCLLAFAFCALHGLKIDDSGVGGDARQFLAVAYNLQHHGVFSEKNPLEGAPEPDAFRPPAYPAFLYAVIQAVPGLAADGFTWLFDPANSPYEKHDGPPLLKTIKYAQVLLYLCAAFMAMWVTERITRSRGWGYGGFALVMFHPFLGSYVNRYYSELLASVLVAGLGLALYQGVRKRSMAWFAGAGLVLGLLVLTRAQWWYCGPACALYAAFVGLLRRREPGAWLKLTAGGVLMVLLMVAVAMPWKMRNERHFGRAFITERAGIALDLRSRYVLMSTDETLASFLYWSRQKELRDKLLPSLMPPERYENLIREKGYYQQALLRHSELARQHPRAEADKIQFQEAADRILSNPLNYLKTLPAITYRGMIDGNLSVFNLIIWFVCFKVVFGLLRRGDWETLAAYAPLMALWGFDSLVTHNITRYNSTGSVPLMIGLAHGLWLRQQRKGAKKAESA